ncbi:putative multiple-sugar transport system permease YteP [Lederbergia ruris]|uniref:Multiple-sugar transport system permease YteP n=1 Tax=Lederbergia ruris TaxID=217495 RepID=A0ABQ4KEK8_9BACI|nr:sugar ABC transporter permease [Lederbergia ruris]GIN55886.1 putative multiple-sugar transport system permease YteP [Lederbergia ruris]
MSSKVTQVIKTTQQEFLLSKGKPLTTRLWKDRWLYLFLLPGLVYFIVYKYLPMWGVLMSFQNYQPHLGIWNSQWVGFKHFERFFSEPEFWMLFRNTLYIAFLDLMIFFPITIIIALLLNEVRKEMFKRFVQTMVYVPHFLSWVVVVGISYILLTTEGGIINELISWLGGDKIPFLMSQDWFRPLIIIQMIWKDAGWGTIIFLAALAGVDSQLYEAARIDGANRWRLLWHITLPSIRSVIVILLILRLGNFLDLGFEQIFLMLNAMNREVGEVFDTYVYQVGIRQGQFSYSAAVGLFKSIVGFILVIGANSLAKKFGEEGIY